MARAPKTKPTAEDTALSLSKAAVFQKIRFWIVGKTPLITHAWSFKARSEMLSKQMGATRAGRDKKDPESDFVNSLYSFRDLKEDTSIEERLKGPFGFPVTGIKNCILSAAHKDKGVARSAVMAALWLDAPMVRTMPALSGAICDMPLARIYGSDPEMREDMVRVGAGLNKTAALAYRAQFTHWAMRITGEFNSSVLTLDQICFLLNEAGVSYGIGEWRNERRGVFGAFRLASEAEEIAWEAFAKGEGPLPIAQEYALAAE